MPGVEAADGLGGLAVGALDDLGLVEDDDVPLQGGHDVDVAAEHGVGGDDDVLGIEAGAALVALEAVEDFDPEVGGEFVDLGDPVADQAGGHDDEGGAVEAAFLVFDDEVGDGLGGLAEAHVVGEEAAEVVGAEVL